MHKNKTKIVHIINNLEFVGGAEKMLLNLISHADKSRFDIFVFSLQNKGEISVEIENLGVPVFHFRLLKKRDLIFKGLKLLVNLKKIRPDIVHTWMYHSNLIGGIGAKLVTNSKIIWSIHATALDPAVTKKSTKYTIKLSSIMSGLIPDRVIFCSHASHKAHKNTGFKSKKMTVIPNGIDVDLFKASINCKIYLKNKLNLDEKIKLIGIVGRYHPMKRHDIFLHAAQIISNKYPLIHFILCGPGVNNSNQKLLYQINTFELGFKVHLLGYISNMSKLYASLDILTVTSSYGEAFPLSICEAMACKLPVISTNLGDVSYIINNNNMIIPINEPMLLAKKWEEIIFLDLNDKNRIGEKNRTRIKELFDIRNISKSYEAYYTQIMNNA